MITVLGIGLFICLIIAGRDDNDNDSGLFYELA
jgi:hypothetical protein